MPATRRLIKQKTRAWNARKRDKKCPRKLAEYREICSVLAGRLKQDQADYERSLLMDSKKDHKRLYSYVNRKQNTKKSVQALKSNDEVVSSKAEMANILNEYFTSVFSEDTGGEVEMEKRESVNELNIVKVNESDVALRLKKLVGEKAAGVDQVQPLILKNCHTAFAIPLTMIFKKSLSDGALPRDWKDANITPLHKKGATVLPENYRPVSLTSVVCKTLERIVREAVSEHLMRKKLITPE
jgi:hypothetical protein